MRQKRKEHPVGSVEEYTGGLHSMRYMEAAMLLRQRGRPLTREAIAAEIERLDAIEACALMQEHWKMNGYSEMVQDMKNDELPLCKLRRTKNP